MEKLSIATNEFSAFLSSKRNTVPHRVIRSFLLKLKEIVESLADECSEPGAKLPCTLLSQLLKQEAKLTGHDGNEFIQCIIETVVHQIQTMRNPESHMTALSAQFEELIALVHSVRSPNKAVDVEVGGIFDFEDVISSTKHLHHYEAHHRDTCSVVMVVLWADDLPGPAMVVNDTPVVYVPLAERCFTEPFEDRSFSEAQREDSMAAQAIIDRHQQKLFSAHSNLIAIRVMEPTPSTGGKSKIQFVVACKRFVPVQNRELLPRELDGVGTVVSSGWLQFCGKLELAHHRPLRPGAGIAAGPDAELILDVQESEYQPPIVGTLGGTIERDGKLYSYGCAHTIRQCGDQTILHPAGTPVLQPTAMGMIVNGAAQEPGLIHAYDVWKDETVVGSHAAMGRLIKRIKDEDASFSTSLPSDAQVGTVVGGILGDIGDGNTNVDVALFRLEVAMEEQCGPSLAHLDLTSPKIVLGESPILDRADFPLKRFKVYGRGARSYDTMEATLSPLAGSIRIRSVSPDLFGLSFDCIHAAFAGDAFQAGDSGTTVWTSDGSLVGMAMACVTIEGTKHCCMLPMRVVHAAVEKILSDL